MILRARRVPAGRRLVFAGLLTLTACGAQSAAEPVPSRVPAAAGATIAEPPAAAAAATTVPPTATAAPVATPTSTVPSAIAVPSADAGPDADAVPSADAGPDADAVASAATAPSTAVAAPAVKSGANVNTDRVIGDPISIYIPSIGVDSVLVPTGVLDDGTMAVPADASTAGWFTGGPHPGERGPAVIMGHVDQKKTGPGVFYHLRDLQVGAQAIIRTTTGDVTFVVTERELILKDQFPTERVYGAVPAPALRLVTCGGSFDRSIGHYRSNVVVYLVPEATS